MAERRARWVPTSTEMPGEERGAVPFAGPGSDDDPHFGSFTSAEDLEGLEPGAAWWCGICERWIPAAEVTHWFDLPECPELPEAGHA